MYEFTQISKDSNQTIHSSKVQVGDLVLRKSSGQDEILLKTYGGRWVNLVDPTSTWSAGAFAGTFFYPIKDGTEFKIVTKNSYNNSNS